MLLTLALLSAHASTLDIDGVCGGNVDINITGLTPNGNFALLTSSGTGTFTMTNGPCAGTQLGLDSNFDVQLIRRANGSGNFSISRVLPVATCEFAVQIVDASTCQLSNVSYIPGPDTDGDGSQPPYDCDDTNPTVFPGATELADGIRNDCDDASWAADAGVVTWFDRDGSTTDYTSAFSAGSPYVPDVVVLQVADVPSDSGTLTFGPGVYYANLTVAGDMGSVTVNGLAGAPSTTIDGGLFGGDPITMNNTGTAAVTDLTIAAAPPPGFAAVRSTAGVMVAPRGFMEVVLTDLVLDDASVLVTDNGATSGGTITVRDVQFTGNGSDMTILAAAFSETIDIRSVDHPIDGGIAITGVDVATTSVTIDGYTNVNGSTVNALLSVTDANVEASNIQLKNSPASTAISISDAALLLTNFAIDDNADGISTRRSTLYAEAGTITNHVATTGAGLTMSESSGEIHDVTLSNNSGGVEAGGAIRLRDISTLDMVDSLVTDNLTGDSPGGGGAYVGPSSTLTCSKVNAASAGFVSNVAYVTGGAVYAADRGSGAATKVISTECDWGTPGLNDNSPNDVFLEAGNTQVFNFGAGASFSCTVDGASSNCI